MLLQITTHGDLWIFHFRKQGAYKHCLKKGTYLCRLIPHPFGAEFDDLVVLSDPSASDPTLESDALVGLSHSSLMTHTQHYSQFPDQVIRVAEVVDTQATEAVVELSAVATAKPAKQMSQIIQLPLRPVPNFSRLEHPRRHLTKTSSASTRHRVQRCHPAARRAC